MISRMLRHFGWMKAKREGDAGQSLVETALTVPILVLVLLGGAELARVAYVSIEVSNAAKAAVAYGAQNAANSLDSSTTSPLGGIQNAAANDASDLTGLGVTLTTTSSHSCICSNGTASTCLNTDCSNAHIQEILNVTTTATFDPLVHVPGLPTTYTVHGNATQKVLGD